MTKSFFITGTDTNIGKTVVSAFMCQYLNADYFKPVQTGEESDSAAVFHLTDLTEDRVHKPAYSLTAPRSPHEAAMKDGVKIDMDEIKLPETNGRPLIVEGAGGVLVPLNENDLMIDLIKKLDLPVIIVAHPELGTINHTLLTIEALRSRDIEIAGVIMNGGSDEQNRMAIQFYGKCEIIWEIPEFEEISKETIHGYLNHMSEEIANSQSS